MARPSRSKKQPAFDPSELEDLIFSPAIGTGVGSHLISDPPGHPAQDMHPDTPKANTPDMSTVVGFVARRSRHPGGNESIRATVTNILERALIPSDPARIRPTTELSTVGTLNPAADSAEKTSAAYSTEARDMTTVVDLATVDTSNCCGPSESDMTTVVGLATVDTFNGNARTPIKEDLSTVVTSNAPSGLAWITEDGDVIAAGRVKRIRLAQDVINAGEEAVYDTLWNAKPLDPNGSDWRIVQVGYDYLMKRTRLAKKTIQRIIDKLLDKDFIAIERPADIYQRTPTVYRVFGYKTVLERHAQKGRTHVAKIGPGFSYVHQMEAARSHSADMATVDISYVSTVDITTTPTVVKKYLSTVVPETTLRIEHSELEQTSSVQVEIKHIAEILRQAIGPVDDDVAWRLITECRRRAPDATSDEISEFIQQKARLAMRNPRIRNPSGFLITAVPLCFEGNSFQIFRKSREEAKQQEKEELQRIAKTILDAPESSDEDRDWARGILGTTTLDENAAYTR